MEFVSTHMRPLLLFLVSILPALSGDLDDVPDFAHAMDIKVEHIDGMPVVMHYGRIRPDFEDRSPNPFRERRSLDGEWLFRFDPEAVGMKENWAGASDLSGWKTVRVPHCWDMMKGGRFWDWSDQTVTNPPFYNGAAWYRREFNTSPAKGVNQRLEFLGVQQRARVFLNGEILATHEGGGQPFSVELGSALKEGKNVLAVQVIRLPNYRKKENGKGFDELYRVHTQAPKASDNWPYAGITRSVSLVSEGEVVIRKVLVRAVDGALEYAVCVENVSGKSRELKLRLSSQVAEDSKSAEFVLDPGGRKVLRLKGTLKQGAKRWSPDAPSVYHVTALLSDANGGVDQVQTEFGIRDFKVIKSRCYLDDSPVFLKGAAFYEEHPTRGPVLTDDDHEHFFELAREADINFFRLHVVQRDMRTYQAGDHNGVMLCGEWGGFWYREDSMSAQTKDTQSIYQSLGRCLVWDLMNHPSVVMWGIHNESHQFGPEYEEFVKMGHELVDELDWQNRPVTWAAWHPHQGDPCFQHADIVGFNEYRGAMDPFEDLDPDLKKARDQNPDKPLIILENGGWSKLGRRGRANQRGTEDWQADLMRRQHEVLIQHTPPLAGYTYWLLIDYRSRKEYTGNEKQNGWSRMGMYNEYRQPKLVRDVFRDLKWEKSASE